MDIVRNLLGIFEQYHRKLYRENVYFCLPKLSIINHNFHSNHYIFRTSEKNFKNLKTFENNLTI